MQRHSIEGERPSLAEPPLSLHLEVWSFGMNGGGALPTDGLLVHGSGAM